MDTVNMALQKMGESVYGGARPGGPAGAGGPTGGPGPGSDRATAGGPAGAEGGAKKDEDVIDAEYEVKD